jgi:hypothetical protein
MLHHTFSKVDKDVLNIFLQLQKGTVCLDPPSLLSEDYFLQIADPCHTMTNFSPQSLTTFIYDQLNIRKCQEDLTFPYEIPCTEPPWTNALVLLPPK